MFNLIKKLFTKKPEEKTQPLVLTDPIKSESEVKVTKQPSKPTATKAKKPKNTKAADVKKTPAKPVSSAQKSKHTVLKPADLEKMTKIEIDQYAEKAYGIKLDRRKRKSDMIADFAEQKRNLKQK